MMESHKKYAELVIIGGKGYKTVVGGEATYKFNATMADWEFLEKDSSDENILRWINNVFEIRIQNIKEAKSFMKDILAPKNLVYMFTVRSNIDRPFIESLKSLYISWNDITKANMKYCNLDVVLSFKKLLAQTKDVCKTIEISADKATKIKEIIKSIVFPEFTLKELNKPEIQKSSSSKKTLNYIRQFLETYRANLDEIQKMEQIYIDIAKKIGEINDILKNEE